MSARIASPWGVVVIARNEGERLRRCLASVSARDAPVVYVDSGSTDDSVELARAFGCETVGLDLARPFTAARARNAGFARLRAIAPEMRFVQFVDGDCEVVDGWLDRAAAFLNEHADAGVVCGRRRERFPERSLYNRLCDEEWDTPVGEARACGGDAMMRAAAFEQAEGFREQLIAGEEPELCLRLRSLGWRVWRLDAEMTLHDAAITRFGQWWRRSRRAGFAFAEGAALHGAAPELHWVREARSATAWGIALPIAVTIGTLAAGPFALLLLLLYPLQIARLTLRGRGRLAHRLARATFLVVGKFAEAAGELRFFASRLARRPAALIEYK
jgi:GT2 family glycosyltransferase